MGAIDEVKQHIDIVNIISAYVPLQKSGRNYKALCPFHQEKTPSFYVFPERQSWHCFGACASGGDVFSFIIKRERMDFGEALRFLAQKAGVSLAPSPRNEAEEKEREELYAINEAAAEYYHQLLLRSSMAEAARSHLYGRGVQEQTIKDFQLGYSLDSWHALQEELARLGIAGKKLIEAGLLVEKEQGGSYDRFRHRLMFPIRNERGRVVGFGARAVDDSLPKYLNSPQTRIFDKSGALYGIERAKEAIRRQNQVVIVEGYIDVIMAHQYGFANVVSSLGTALTEKQVGILKKFTRNLTLALDKDAAGEIATLRGGELAARSLDPKIVPAPTTYLVSYESILDAKIEVISLPAGKDPDQVIREDAPTWQQLVAKALPVIDYTFQMVTGGLDLSQVKDRSKAMEQLLPVIREIKEPVWRSHYLQKLSRLTRVEERILNATLQTLSRQVRGQPAPETSVSALISSLSPRDPLEGCCLALLVSFPELREGGEKLSQDYFERSENRELFLAWYNNPEDLSSQINPVLQEHLESIRAYASLSLEEEKRRRAFAECARRLEERWLMQCKAREEFLLAEAEAQGDKAQVEKLLEESIKLNVQLKEVFERGLPTKSYQGGEEG